MIMGMEIPFEWAVLLGAAGVVAGIWIGQRRASRKLRPQHDPLRKLWQPAVRANATDIATRRDSRRQGSHAVLHGRIDQLSGRNPGWDADTRDQVREHVAAVMRAGLRRSDQIVLNTCEGGSDGFTILIHGADEHVAVRIADRLRTMLTHLRMPQLGVDARLTASFGVAADQYGETEAGLDLRAHAALGAAVAKGRDHVVPATEIEDVLFLPAPTPSVAACAA